MYNFNIYIIFVIIKDAKMFSVKKYGIICKTLLRHLDGSFFVPPWQKPVINLLHKIH